jgi:hypothetical protein
MGEEPFKLNSTFDFSAHSKYTDRLCTLADNLFKHINENIAKSDAPTINAKRHVKAFTGASELPLFYGTDRESTIGQTYESSGEEFFDNSLFGVVLKKFKELGLIFSYKRQPYHWDIQA